jgi:hypothetical protein
MHRQPLQLRPAAGVLATVLLSGCFVAGGPPSPIIRETPRATATAQLEPNRELTPNDFGNAPWAVKNFTVTIENRDQSTRPIDLSIRVSKDRFGSAGYSVVAPPPGARTATGWRVTREMIASLNRLDNDRLIVFDAKGANDSTTQVFAVRYRTPWSGPTFVAPVLYRLDGTAGGFSAEGLAPSIGGLVKWFRGLSGPEYFGLIPLATVYRSEKDEDKSRPYSLALGGAIDLGGWIQIGSSYHFKAKRPAVIIGLRPEVWTQLFSGSK